MRLAEAFQAFASSVLASCDIPDSVTSLPIQVTPPKKCQKYLTQIFPVRGPSVREQRADVHGVHGARGDPLHHLLHGRWPHLHQLHHREEGGVARQVILLNEWAN